MREKASRPAHRVIPKSHFARLDTIDAVIQKLIGDVTSPTRQVS
jgi:hypothetical protein